MNALPRRAILGAGALDERGRVVITRVLSPENPLRPADVLLAVDGLAVSSVHDLTAQIRAASSSTVRARVLRDGAERELALKLATMPSEPIEGAEVRYGEARWRGHRLRTIAVIPPDPIATIVFVQGMGLESVDHALSPHAPLAALVAAWSARGLASVRIERPGVGDSEGPPPSELDLDAERELARAALDTVRGPVVLFGHSLGGLIAALSDDRADAIIAYGSPGAPWTATAREGLARQLQLRAADEARIAERLRRFDADPFEARHGRSLALHQQLAALDVPGAWRGVDVPVQVVIGEHDWVTGRAAQRAIAEHAPDAHVVELDGLDHAFTRHPSLEASLRDYGRGAFDPRIADATAALATKLRGP